MTQVVFAAEITKRYGAVTRARGYFLYTRKGVRLVDMYQEGGRAILGWGGHQFTVFKNVLNRGLTGNFDTDYSARVAKAAKDLLGDQRAVFVFTDKNTAIRNALTFSKDGTSLWKPWRKNEFSSVKVDGAAESYGECVIIEPPLAWAEPIYILAVEQKTYEAHLASGFPALQSARIPAPLSVAIARAIYDLISEIPKRTEKNWFIYDKALTKYWNRKGAYLTPKISEKEYDEFVCHCLDCGVIISPDYNIDSIVPYGVDKGVFSKLEKNPFCVGVTHE